MIILTKTIFKVDQFTFYHLYKNPKEKEKLIGCSTEHLKKIFWIPNCTYISQSTVFLHYPTPGYNQPDPSVWSQYRIVYHAVPCAGVLNKINPGRKRAGKSNGVFFSLHKYHNLQTNLSSNNSFKTTQGSPVCKTPLTCNSSPLQNPSIGISPFLSTWLWTNYTI